VAHKDELAVMASIRTELEQLPDDASRARVVRWAADLANIAVRPAVQTPELPASQATRGGESLGAILDRASPQTRPDLILAVAHWLELSTGGKDWSSQALNDELKQLGRGVPNITDALSGLIAKKPAALVRQTGKSGRAQQARKRYALTAAGKARVAALSGATETES
jgi:hypothetical protein